MSAPDRIGLVSDGMGNWFLWNKRDFKFDEAVPYVRADIAADLLAALEEAVSRQPKDDSCDVWVSDARAAIARARGAA